MALSLGGVASTVDKTVDGLRFDAKLDSPSAGVANQLSPENFSAALKSGGLKAFEAFTNGSKGPDIGGIADTAMSGAGGDVKGFVGGLGSLAGAAGSGIFSKMSTNDDSVAKKPDNSALLNKVTDAAGALGKMTLFKDS